MTMISPIELTPIKIDNYLEVVSPNTIRLKEHRIGLEHIVERYLEGYTPEQMAQDFPGVSLVQIYAVITYYLQHRPQVDAYLTELNKQAETAYQTWLNNPSPAMLKIRQLKAQRQIGL